MKIYFKYESLINLWGNIISYKICFADTLNQKRQLKVYTALFINEIYVYENIS